MSGHTPGPWPIEWTGDHKRILIGNGLVEGPNGYEVAEVYSDDCPREVAEANANLIAAAPDLLAAVRELMDQPTMNPLDMTPAQRAKLWTAHANARAAISKAEGR